MPKSGSLKFKEREEAERKKSAECCKSIINFIISQPPSTLMSSSETNHHEEKISSHRDDAVMCESEEQRSITLDTDTKTSACFANQSRPSTSPFIVPISVETALPTSEIITSTSEGNQMLLQSMADFNDMRPEAQNCFEAPS
ncbi:hypothetical protein AVEN_153114-1 [Araneus ventricosus]|uniref:Uncharacterized protein n=1 Tax=Araneus ventricosus TaxID=182803 RepID=A0A4Y2IH43_ARAVE|nr:hypothetical protein AVEN_153114-1 [Araneus ventricosus]